MFNYFSMFTGIGGFELGIQNAYANLSNTEGAKQRRLEKQKINTMLKQEQLAIQPLCIGYSEIDKYAIQIYQNHFIHKNYGDATKINARELPNFDLLCGGFPCQAFSIAGKRHGFGDTRGTLFFDIARIIEEKRPKYLLLENVKGLLSHDGGRTFKIIVAKIAELGYCCEWQVLNSKYFGVPQNRERVFIVGYFGKLPGRKIFPYRENDEIFDCQDKPNQGRTQTQVSHTLKAAGNIKADDAFVLEQVGIIKKDSEATRVYNPSGIARTIKNGGGMGAKTGLYEIDKMKIRRLTPTECERLQGFPDGWTAGLSDAQRYKCLGNAVTVNVVQAIIKKLINNLSV